MGLTRGQGSQPSIAGLGCVSGVHRNKKRRLMSAMGHKQTSRRHLDYVRFTPKSGHRLGHSRRQLFANAAIEEPDWPPTRGSGQILTQLRLRRALANCSGRFRDDHLCEGGRA